jgi:heat shock protein HslJ
MPFPVPTRRVAGVLLMAAALTACSTPRQAELAQARYQPAYASDFLAQTSWVLARWTRVGGTLRPVPHDETRDRPITISFTHEGPALRVTGFAGCNNYASNYTVANGNLIVTAAPVSTRMACYPADRAPLERDFLSALTRIRATAVDNTGNPRRLTLSLDDGDILDFARRVDPVAGGERGVTKLVYVNSQQVACGATAMRPLCLQVRDSDNQPWQTWAGDIVGFQYRPGIVYRLRIVETPLADPQPGMPPVRWVLDTVVEQRVVGH